MRGAHLRGVFLVLSIISFAAFLYINANTFPESGALRKILDTYLEDIETKGLLFEPYRKTSPLGMKILPRTITIEQDRKLREIAERTGWKISN